MVHYFQKGKRYEKGLVKFKLKIEEDFAVYKDSYLDDLKRYKEEFVRDFIILIKNLELEIFNIDKQEWAEIRNEYNRQKEELLKKIKALE